MKTLPFYTSFCVCLLGLTACSQKTSFMEQDRLQAEGNYREAIIHAQNKIDKNDKSA
ncbi:MAG: hypothetical protein IBX43_07665 [Campylobacterales bacterium]|nr:hypothetical protein [Campylobacterales bacterium]